jgi:CMP-N-acetylneuraminic acid synthetase
MAVIPARGGSKGIFKKNIKYLAGKPLIVWTIEMSLKTPCIDRVIVSTDSEDITDVARDFGAEVPFLRPPELAQDDTPDLPVYQHALAWMEESENYCPDIVVWLRPTAPLRTSEDIKGAVNKLLETNADWVRSVCLVEHHPYWMYRMENERLDSFVRGVDIRKYYQRHLLPPVYRINGAVDVAWRKTVMEKELSYSGDVCAYVMPVERSIDIDTVQDLAFTEFLLKGKYK